MSGSGSGSGAPDASGIGDPYISVGGITVQLPSIMGTPYAQEIFDISVCAAIIQMASLINNSTVSALLQRAATKALGMEGSQLAQETNSPVSPAP